MRQHASDQKGPAACASTPRTNPTARSLDAWHEARLLKGQARCPPPRALSPLSVRCHRSGLCVRASTRPVWQVSLGPGHDEVLLYTTIM
eukprot:4457010-Prymnesium_polylepis.1